MVGRSGIGVGFIGAGPVTQAIHLPTLARRGDAFRVVHIADLNAPTAESVAARVGARWSTDPRAVIDDPEVEVVVVGSPHRFHAEQVLAACAAGKRAVLSEKPLAVDAEQADLLRSAVTEAGVPLVVGAMHSYDAGWTAGLAEFQRHGGPVRDIRSTIVLPPNPLFEEWATEVAERVTPPAREQDDADRIRDGILGLAIHDLPLIRRLVGDTSSVTVKHAAVVQPWGYLVVLEIGGCAVELHARTGVEWQPDWRLVATSDSAELDVDFPPSYVHSGSAVARVRTAESTTEYGPWPVNGYEQEWIEVHDVLEGAALRFDADSLVEDVRFAFEVADGCERYLRGEGDAR